ncbi:MAG: pyridoxal phosphate-dependent aminotransferase [Pseudomonadales bacterium]
MSLYFSQLTERLGAPGSDVWQIHEEALLRQRAGEDIILLSVGDPDFPTPSYITEHTVDAINRGRTHYAPAAGEFNLREAIAELESSTTGKSFDASQFVIFPGATAALYAVFASIADPGDEIIVPEPMYAGYQGLFDALGLSVRYVALKAPRFELDVEQVFAAVTARTRGVLVNTPGNPCGNILPQTQLRELAQGCLARNLWLVSDEVYSLITFDAPHWSLLRHDGDPSNLVVIDGLSKSHAMSGWRLGWAAAPPELAVQLARFSSAALFGVCQFVQDGAAYALANDSDDVAAMREEYRRRRDYAAARLDGIPRLAYFMPQGGMFMMVDASQICNDGADFARRLLDEAGLSTIPGRGFGPSAATYVRMSLTHPEPVLAQVFDRMADVAAR